MVTKKTVITEVGKASEEQLANWRVAHSLREGQILVAKVQDGINTHFAYCKVPGRNTLARAVTYMRQDKVVEAGLLILEQEWIGGSEVLKKDEQMLLGAAIEIGQSAFIMPAEVQKY